MKKYWLLLLVLAGRAGSMQAQDKAPSKWLFNSFITGGLIKGSETTTGMGQTVNGFRKNHLFAGLGVGIDPYRFAGIPVFADARYFAGKKPSAFFLYADAGIHCPIKKAPPGSFYTIRYLNGFYGDMGIGYVFADDQRTGFVVQAGYTFKRVAERQSYWIHPVGAPDYESIDLYRYNLNRLVCKLGFRF